MAQVSRSKHNEIIVDFELIPSDFHAFNYYYNWSRPEKLAHRLRITRLFPLVMFLPAIVSWILWRKLSIFDCLFPVTGIAMIFTGEIIKIREKFSNYSNEKRIMIFRREYLQIELNNKILNAAWINFSTLRETREHLFLYKTEKEVIIIPKNIFTNEDQISDLKKTIEAQLNKAYN